MLVVKSVFRVRSFRVAKDGEGGVGGYWGDPARLVDPKIPSWAKEILKCPEGVSLLSGVFDAEPISTGRRNKLGFIITIPITSPDFDLSPYQELVANSSSAGISGLDSLEEALFLLFYQHDTLIDSGDEDEIDDFYEYVFWSRGVKFLESASIEGGNLVLKTCEIGPGELEDFMDDIGIERYHENEYEEKFDRETGYRWREPISFSLEE